MKKLICGVGINDAQYSVTKESNLNGKRSTEWMCPFYSKWKHMIERCYSASRLKTTPPYKDCTVCNEWLTFSNFKYWMENQDWGGKQLDKDILFKDNKIYSPNTCVFISNSLNSFIIDNGASRGEYPIGVDWEKTAIKFRSKCRNPFTKKRDFLGYFDCQHKAHKAWLKRKHELACQYANMQTDQRISRALMARFL